MDGTPQYLWFKTDQERAEWEDPRLSVKLKVIVADLAHERMMVMGQPTVVTNVWESAEEAKALHAKSRTHEDWRAVDCRVDHTMLQAEESVRQRINTRWPTGLEPTMPRIPPLDHAAPNPEHYHVQTTIAEKIAEVGKIAGLGVESPAQEE